MPNRLLQLGTIAFLFIATAVNILQTDQLSQKENMIPSKVKDYSVISSEKKVDEDLLNDIRILEKYKNIISVIQFSQKSEGHKNFFQPSLFSQKTFYFEM